MHNNWNFMHVKVRIWKEDILYHWFFSESFLSPFSNSICFTLPEDHFDSFFFTAILESFSHMKFFSILILPDPFCIACDMYFYTKTLLVGMTMKFGVVYIYDFLLNINSFSSHLLIHIKYHIWDICVLMRCEKIQFQEFFWILL